MEIKPLPGIVQLKLNDVKVAGLDTSSKLSAVEFAEVVSAGDNVPGISVGDRVFVKSWGLDIIDHEGERYVFCNTETKSILAVVKI